MTILVVTTVHAADDTRIRERLIRTLAEGFKAYAPAYSPDGSTLALCGWQARDDGQGVVRLYGAATGRMFNGVFGQTHH